MNEKQKAAMYLSQLEQSEANPVEYVSDYPSEHMPKEKKSEEKTLSEQEKARLYLSQLEEQPENQEIHRPLGKAALRQVGRVGRSLATGVSSIGDIPNIAALGLHAAGLKEIPEFYSSPSGYVQKKIDTLTGGKLRPENKAEEYMDIIGEGAAPAILTGGAGLAGQGLRHAAKQIAKRLTSKSSAANVGSSVGAKSYIDSSDDPSMLGVLASSIAGGKGAAILRNPHHALTSGLGKITGFSPEKYAKQTDLGIPTSISSTSKFEYPTMIENAASKMPLSMGVLGKHYAAKETAIARNLGVSTPHDLEHAVSNPKKYLAKQGAEGFHQQKSNEYNALSEQFSPRALQAKKNLEMVDISDIKDKLSQGAAGLVDPAELALFHKTPEGRYLNELNKLSSKGFSKKEINDLRKLNYTDEMIHQLDEKNKGNSIKYASLDALRRQAVKEKDLLKRGTAEYAEMSHIKGLLSGKRHEFMEKIGSPTEIQSSREARKLWSNYASKDESNLKHYVYDLTGTDNEKLAFGKLKNNPKYFHVAREGLPKHEQPLLAQAFLSDLGERQGRFNINKAHTGFNDLERPIKIEFLKSLPNLGAQKNFLETMKYMGENKRVMEKLANTSGTTQTTEFISLAKKYGVATLATMSGAGAAAVGSWIPLIASSALLSGGSRLWTNQNFLKRMNDTITAKTPRAQANHMDLLIKSIETGAKQSTYQRKADEKKKLHIMMTPSRAYQIN